MKRLYLVLILFSLFSVNAFGQNRYEHLNSLVVDTISSEGTISVYSVKLSSEQLEIHNSVEEEEIVLKVIYNEDGMILDKVMGYEPQENEITFFYAKNTQTMYFLFGELLRETYLEKEFSQLIKIVEILEHKIFDQSSFSGMQAYGALEKYK